MKNISITLQDLFDLKGAELINPHLYKSANNVSTDSRALKKNSIFIAIKGERFDGHKFIEQAVKNGASTIIVEKKKIHELPDMDCTIVAVQNTIKALGELAKTWRNKLNAKVIGITGSSGKTTLKEMIASILSEKFKVSKTFLNDNNHIGVPLTILNTKGSDEILVAELGSNHFGEIEYTASILRPDLALVTNIGNSHLEFLHSKKEVLKEKSSLLKITDINGGLSFINNDDNLLKNYSRKLSNTISYGFNNYSEVKGEILGYDNDGKAILVIQGMGKKLKIVSPLPGEHNAHNLLAALSVALSLRMTKSEILNGIKKITATPKRFNIIKLPHVVLIDDTYNANPESVAYAIDTINKFNSGLNKVLILGDMLELGDRADELHASLSNHIKKNKAMRVLLIGKLMKHLYLKLIELKIKSFYFDTRSQMNKYLATEQFRNTVILIKGSRGMKMEEFVDVIKRGAAK
ncbi:MAG: UDP-N-acetylmuramoyl-tripeptide--D-alanyl-D-alanine ligase [Ignavibacteriales bacterium]|nr:UDP-N-acetylmuramoyl-tripeptide--D-alanyl-D-alanine ligase [Ignavibacteriales bacterium]